MAKELQVLRVDAKDKLEDGAVWINRFEIRSETSGRIYVVSQHKINRHWGCSCPAWRTRRTCKHLINLQLPCHEQPHEVQIKSDK